MLKLPSALTAIGFAAAMSVASTAADAAAADTKTKHRAQRHSARVAPPPVGYAEPRSQLELNNQRSWLEPGGSAPEGNGQGSHYVQTLTTLSQTPDMNYDWRFGNQTLPRRFEIPSDQGPTLEFWTPRW